MIALTTVSSSNVFVLSESQKVTCLIDDPSDFATNSFIRDCYKRRLMTIAENNLMALHRVDEDLKAVPSFSKRKIAIGKESKPDSISACWAPGNTIAISCAEEHVRMFDVDTDVVYNLRLPDDALPQETDATPVHITAIASFTGVALNNPLSVLRPQGLHDAGRWHKHGPCCHLRIHWKAHCPRG